MILQIFHATSVLNELQFWRLDFSIIIGYDGCASGKAICKLVYIKSRYSSGKLSVW